VEENLKGKNRFFLLNRGCFNGDSRDHQNRIHKPSGSKKLLSGTNSFHIFNRRFSLLTFKA